jgi:hypothetical protein
MKKGYSISVQYSDLKFAKKFKIYDTIQNTNYNYSLDGKLYRNQYYWQVLLSKQIKSTRKSLLGASTGIMFINDGEQFSIQYAGVRNISNPSASFYEFRSWEFGVPAAIFYERKLSTNISLGVKAQAYIIISVGSFEAVSLNPYISARF